MNDLDLCLEVVSRSRQSLWHTWRWISRKPLEIEVWFQRTTNRKWHVGYQMVTWPMTSRDPRRCCEAVRSAILAIAWLLVNRWVRTSRQRCHITITITITLLIINPSTPTIAIWLKHPVPDRVKSSFEIFDTRALWRSVLGVRVPGCRKLQTMA